MYTPTQSLVYDCFPNSLPRPENVPSNRSGEIATKQEKTSLLKRCANDPLWNYLINALADTQATYRLVEWTGRHPWEIQINVREFTMEWNKLKGEKIEFARLARNLTYYQRVKAGMYDLMVRYKKLGVYRFFKGYEGNCLPTLDETQLFADEKVHKRLKRTTVRDPCYRIQSVPRSPIHLGDIATPIHQNYFNAPMFTPVPSGGNSQYDHFSLPTPKQCYERFEYQMHTPPTTPREMYSVTSYPPAEQYLPEWDQNCFQFPDDGCQQYAVYSQDCVQLEMTPVYGAGCGTAETTLQLSQPTFQSSSPILEGDVTEFFKIQPESNPHKPTHSISIPVGSDPLSVEPTPTTPSSQNPFSQNYDFFNDSKFSSSSTSQSSPTPFSSDHFDDLDVFNPNFDVSHFWV